MDPPASLRPVGLLAFAILLVGAGSCGGGGALDARQALTAGDFLALATNMAEGEVWQLNRAIRVEFNHPLDPASIGFHSFRVEGTSGAALGRPVTGSFALEPGSGGRVIVFQPSCPTSDQLDDGGLLPGGHGYRLSLPTSSSFGGSVLRDRAGHPLVSGLGRRFVTPAGGQGLFIDAVPTPPRIVGLEWPRGLNLFTDPEPAVRIFFDQAIDGRASNLNGEHLELRYSDDTVGSGLPPSFGSVLPGRLVLEENCSAAGATVRFELAGLLPPDRLLRVELRNTFRDIAGQTNAVDLVSAAHRTPLLSQVYGDALLGWSDDQEAIDEFRDDLDDGRWLDPAAALAVPPAAHEAGQLVASFEFAGSIGSSADLTLLENTEVLTTGQVVLLGEGGRSFLVNNGVLLVDDFLLGPDAVLRARGPNPLVLYVQGRATIEGMIDLSGEDSHWPTSLNSPQFPEGPVPGECGGGLGGMSSRISTALTPRGDNGGGAFDLGQSGGQGGEGGLNQLNGTGQLYHLAAGGGGGGTFALTPNEAILWTGWVTAQRPRGVDNNGPDHLASRHPYWPDGVYRDPLEPLRELPVPGGEAGVRGSSYGAVSNYDPRNPPGQPHGVYGMEDGRPDYVDPADSATDLDPAWDLPAIPFDHGHPTDGADPGQRGIAVFNSDGDTSDDFWGTRINADGSASRGELLAPWAGSGGGASGDSFQVNRRTDPLTGRLLTVVESLPTPTWPPVAGVDGFYRKGAPGGGGGGQFLLLAIGPIELGPAAEIRGNGGIGHGGEATVSADHQVSGSGGGSGGHLVLHSATAIDLRRIDIGAAASAAQVEDLAFSDAVLAIGGRRGWCASYLTQVPVSGLPDGNGDLMMGRGGAGGNGVVQFHVPDPGRDLLWPAAAAPGIEDFVRHSNPQGPADPDRLEEVLHHFARPRPYVLVPFFGSTSQAQSVWIDTGLAALRAPAAGQGPFPDWADAALRFAGVGPDGSVPVAGGQVVPLPELLRGPLAAASFQPLELRIAGARGLFAGQEHFLRSPAALIGYDVMPEADGSLSFEIVAAAYDPAADELRLNSRPGDGPMTGAVVPGQPWALRPKFFRLDALGVKDHLPASAGVWLEFQGTSDPSEPAATVPGPIQWTTDLELLRGLRWIRWRVTFEIDRLGQGVGPASPRPALSYLKLPFVW